MTAAKGIWRLTTNTQLRPDVANQVVVMTGATSEIGKQTALRFARCHARLALGSRSVDALERMAGECRDAGAADVVVQSTDVADADQVRQLFDVTLAQFGRVDIVVQCAATIAFGRLEDLPVDVFETVIQTNLTGAANVSRSALAQFRRRGRGHLVLLDSLLGQAAMPYQLPYVVGRFDLHGMVRALRQENSHLPGVKVHGIYPAPVETSISGLAGNFFGRAGRVLPTTVGPDTVAAVIVAATICSYSTKRHVGWLKRPLVLAHQLLASFFDAIAGRFPKIFAFTTQPTEITGGNVPQSSTTESVPQIWATF